MRQLLLHPVLILFATSLVGCAIPPRPQSPELTHIAPLAGVPAKAGAVWPDAAWWQRYGDTQLNDLQARALAGSPTLAVARARFDEAARAVDVARAAGGASMQGNAQLQRERLSEHGLIPSQFLGFNWYSQGDLGIAFNYDFDFWGSHGADIAAAIDRARAAAAERDAAATMLTAAVAETYFGWQADHARLAIANDLVANAVQAQRIAAARVQRGIDPADTLHRANVKLAGARDQVAQLAGATAIAHAALASLIGTAPQALGELQVQPLPLTGGGMPAQAGIDLLARRADVAASRWRVDAALKDVDVARDAFFPDLSLSALVGLSSIDLGKLLAPGSAVIAAGPALHLPIFEGGRLRARFGVSQAALTAAIADYNAAVVEAARDAATQALSVQQVQARLPLQAVQLQAAEQLQETARAREQGGLTDARPLLAAAADFDNLRDAQIQLQRAALSADIALTRALGGGYRASASSHPTTSGARSP
ncbi:MAG: efflux transporter outer membrane subunit [Rudaea sp.]